MSFLLNCRDNVGDADDDDGDDEDDDSNKYRSVVTKRYHQFMKEKIILHGTDYSNNMISGSDHLGHTLLFKMYTASL